MNSRRALKSVTQTIAYAACHPLKALQSLNHWRILETKASPADSIRGNGLNRQGARPLKLMHIAAFVNGNAGDVLLPIVLRDLFDHVIDQSTHWQTVHAHPTFQSSDACNANRMSGVVIGGGGLFLRDTNPNDNSGWQWNCPVSQLREVQAPIVVFAVGYNRFRDQADFAPVFREHLTLLAEKSVYIGLRNSGSMKAIKSYLPTHLHPKVRFQPCMTTLLSTLYPNLMQREDNPRFKIAFNAAFDRPELRFPDGEVKTLLNLCKALKVACGDDEIDVVSHCVEDSQILPFAREAGLKFRHINLMGKSPESIVQYYAQIDLAIGMRGHAQMIPFGCGTPIISLISHDKLRWFLEDIERTQWGVEVSSKAIDEELDNLVTDIRRNTSSYRNDILSIQSNLWKVSERNIRDACNAFGMTDD